MTAVPGFPMTFPEGREEFLALTAKALSIRIKLLEREKAEAATTAEVAYGRGMEDAIAIFTGLHPSEVNAAAKRMLSEIEAKEARK